MFYYSLDRYYRFQNFKEKNQDIQVFLPVCTFCHSTPRSETTMETPQSIPQCKEVQQLPKKTLFVRQGCGSYISVSLSTRIIFTSEKGFSPLKHVTLYTKSTEHFSTFLKCKSQTLAVSPVTLMFTLNKKVA